MTDATPPAEISWLTDALGVEGTLALMEAYAGVRVYVPAHPNQGSPLARAVGLAVAQGLAQLRPGETIKVPAAKNWRTHVYKGRGLSNSAIAKRLGIDESTVARHLNPVPSRFDQYDLGF